MGDSSLLKELFLQPVVGQTQEILPSTAGPWQRETELVESQSQGILNDGR